MSARFKVPPRRSATSAGESPPVPNGYAREDAIAISEQQEARMMNPEPVTNHKLRMTCFVLQSGLQSEKVEIIAFCSLQLSTAETSRDAEY